jgi:AraC-like DNA-binding protein
MSGVLDETPSSFGATAVALYQTLQSYDVDAEGVVRDAGVDVTSFADPSARISQPDLERLVALAIKETGDECIGLRFSDYVHPTTFNSLGVALLSSHNLREFCQRLQRYYSFLTTNEVVEFEEVAGEGHLIFRAAVEFADASVARALIEGSMATILRFIRFMYRPDFTPQRTEVTWEVPQGYAEHYLRYFGRGVEFGMDQNVLSLAREDLDFPLPAANAELARQNDEVVLEFLARMKKGDLPTQVHARLIQLLPSGSCSKEEVARGLGMSVRALHNRLGDAGSSYQSLLDRTRQQLAEQYMRQKNLTVSEVAYLLGFSDGSNFSRAFHRWTGVSPTEFRNEIRKAH